MIKKIVCMTLKLEGDNITTGFIDVLPHEIEKIVQYDYSDDINREKFEKKILQNLITVFDVNKDGGDFCEVFLKDKQKQENLTICLLKECVDENDIDYLYKVEKV